MIKNIKNPTNKQIANFEKFALKNWGEHSHNGDPGLDFFDLHRIIYEKYINNRLVSGLVVFFKTLVFSDRTIHIAGIGGVVTHINFRNKGFASEVLAFALKDLKSMDLDVALLCTDIGKLGKLYGKVGFVPINKSYYFVNKLGVKKKETGGMITKLRNNNAYNFILSTKEEIFVGLSNF